MMKASAATDFARALKRTCSFCCNATRTSTGMIDWKQKQEEEKRAKKAKGKKRNHTNGTA